MESLPSPVQKIIERAAFNQRGKIINFQIGILKWNKMSKSLGSKA